MNCQDIARILDEREVDGLLSEEQSDVQAHLANCRDCARDWQIHAQLSQARIPAVPTELRALYSVQAAGVADFAVRRRGRFVVIGAIVAVAAAAAMLVVQLTGTSPPVVAHVESPPMEATVTPVASPDLPVAESDVHVVQVARTAPEAEQTHVVARATPAQFRIVVMPTRHDSPEKAAIPAIDAFQSSLLQALRKVADVAVEVAGDPGTANDLSANRVTVVSPGFTTLPSGQRLYQSGETRNGSSASGSSSGPARWPVEVVAQPEIQRVQNGSFTLKLEIDSSGNPGGGRCGSSNTGLNITGSAPSDASSGMALCSSVDHLVARLIEVLRQHAQAQTTNATQFSARLTDTSLSATDRQFAFSELLTRSRQSGVPLDASSIDAISTYVASLPPDERARVWQRLYGVRQTGLVLPLLESLQHDPDEKVRREALSTLIMDYGSDSRVLAALESVARQDASRFVRLAAQRPLSGDAQWQTYVMETLADKGLPAAQRLAPANYGMRSVVDRAAREKTRTFMGSDEVTSLLLDMFKELQAEVRSSGEDTLSVRAQDDAMSSVLSLLSNTNPSAALDLQIRILEDPVPNSMTTGRALNALIDQRDNPRVSKVLDDIAAGKAGQQLRTSLERELAMRQQRATPGNSFGRPF